MIGPCALSINALHFYFKNPEHINRGEALIGIGYVSIFSMVIAFPYIATLVLLRKRLYKNFTLISATPFLIMGAIVIYATYLGVPW